MGVNILSWTGVRTISCFSIPGAGVDPINHQTAMGLLKALRGVSRDPAEPFSPRSCPGVQVPGWILTAELSMARRAQTQHAALCSSRTRLVMPPSERQTPRMDLSHDSVWLLTYWDRERGSLCCKIQIWELCFCSVIKIYIRQLKIDLRDNLSKKALNNNEIKSWG